MHNQNSTPRRTLRFALRSLLMLVACGAAFAQVPSAPIKLTAYIVPAPSTLATLNWVDTSNGAATGFKIERKTLLAGTYAQIATTTTASFSDSGLASATAYMYRVRATGPGGDSGYSNEFGVATAVPNVTTNGTTLTYKYDPFGNLLQTNAGGVITSIQYDLRGRKTQMVDPDLGTWTYRYNALGELIWQCDPVSRGLQSVNGDCTDAVASRVLYDPLGRVQSRTERDLTSKWFYDSYPAAAPEWNATLQTGLTGDCSKGVGKLCYVSADDGYRRLLTYDGFGRSLETNTLIDSAYKTSVSYDSASRVATITYPDGFSVTNSYTFGYLSQVKNSATNASLWQRTSVSISSSGTAIQDLLGDTATGSTLTAASNYDVLGRLTSATAGTVHNLSYSYDTVGNVQTRTNNAQSRTAGYTLTATAPAACRTR